MNYICYRNHMQGTGHVVPIRKVTANKEATEAEVPIG